MVKMKIQLDLTEEEIGAIDFVSTETDVEAPEDIVLNALVVYSALLALTKDGQKLFVETTNGSAAEVELRTKS